MMPSSFANQYCFFAVEKDSQNKANEYDTLDTCIRTQVRVEITKRSRRNEDVLSSSPMSGVVNFRPIVKTPRLVSWEIWTRSVRDWLTTLESVVPLKGCIEP